MRLSVQEDIELGQGAAFEQVIDIDFLERQLMRRGIEIVRTDTGGAYGEGAAWAANVPISGQTREAQGQITRWAPPEAAVMEAVSGGLVAELAAEFSALSTSSTRMRVTLDVSAVRFRDRMLLKTLQMTKTRLSGRFSRLVEGFAREAERRAAGA